MKMSTLVAPQALDKVLSLSKITDIVGTLLVVIENISSSVIHPEVPAILAAGILKMFTSSIISRITLSSM